MGERVIVRDKNGNFVGYRDSTVADTIAQTADKAKAEDAAAIKRSEMAAKVKKPKEPMPQQKDYATFDAYLGAMRKWREGDSASQALKGMMK